MGGEKIREKKINNLLIRSWAETGITKRRERRESSTSHTTGVW